MPEPLTITEFGRRCGLSHIALRLYDLSGCSAPPNGAATAATARASRTEPGASACCARRSLLLATAAEVLAGCDEEAAYRLGSWWSRVQQAMAAVKIATVITRVVDQSGLTDALVDGVREIRRPSLVVSSR